MWQQREAGGTVEGKMAVPPNHSTLTGARHDIRTRNMDQKLEAETRIAIALVIILSGALAALSIALTL